MKPILNQLTTGASHKNCFICKKKHSPKNRLKSIDSNTVIESFKRFNIYIRKDSRCCRKHFNTDGSFDMKELNNIMTLKIN